MARQKVLSLAALLLGAAVGCQGIVEGMGGTGSGSQPGGNGQPPGMTGTPGTNPGGTGGTPTVPGGAPGTPAGMNPSTPADQTAAGPMPLNRLNQREYNNTVRDLLGDTSNQAAKFQLDFNLTDFAYHRAAQVTTQDASDLNDAAGAIAAGVETKVQTLAPCVGADENACASTFIKNFGQRAYRRPLTSEETARLTALYMTGRTTLALNYAGGVRLLVEAMLQSPAFIYHWELGPNPATVEGKVVKLSPYETASRLSYFLWQSMPDQALFDAAAQGKLVSDADVTAQAKRMITDPRAKETVAEFAEEWLGLDQVAARPKDPMIYPEFNAALTAAMDAEQRAFVGNAVFGAGGKFSNLLLDTSATLSAPLATLYGVAGVNGTAARDVTLDKTQRAGLLTRAGFLTVTGATDGSHPVKRGRRIYERFMCGELPPPPNNVPPAKPASAGGTTRQRFEEHDKNPCATACHTLMDPFGFAFEHYDGIGKYRTQDNGMTVDSSGTLDLDGQKHPYNDALGMSQILAASPSTARCFATQLARFAFKRTETEADRASIDAVMATFGKTNAVQDALLGLVATRTFRYRSPGTGEMLQ
jgi:hypothetical protein